MRPVGRGGGTLNRFREKGAGRYSHKGVPRRLDLKGRMSEFLGQEATRGNDRTIPEKKIAPFYTKNMLNLFWEPFGKLFSQVKTRGIDHASAREMEKDGGLRGKLAEEPAHLPSEQKEGKADGGKVEKRGLLVGEKKKPRKEERVLGAARRAKKGLVERRKSSLHGGKKLPKLSTRKEER